MDFALQVFHDEDQTSKEEVIGETNVKIVKR